jgi:hypothetical protein
MHICTADDKHAFTSAADANDTFSRAASRGQEDRFSRAGSAASQQSDRFMKHVNAEGYGTIFQKREADEERGNLFERAIEGMKPDIYGGEVSGLPDSAQRHKNSAHCPEDEGPRTPVMHIEPRRLCLKKVFRLGLCCVQPLARMFSISQFNVLLRCI